MNLKMNYMLDRSSMLYYTVIMNKKSTRERALILQHLCEGCSIRGTARLLGVNKETILKLLVATGEACEAYQDKVFTNLPCKRVEVDEIFSYVHTRGKNAPEGATDVGTFWVWTSLCPDTKLAPCWCVGGRDERTAKAFMADLAPRFSGRVQLTSDGFKSYIPAVDEAFGCDVDFGMLVKQYGEAKGKKFGPYKGSIKERISGSPDMEKLTTAHVERNNLGMRMGMKRFTRRTDAFSKKLHNHKCAISLHFMAYNFCKVHGSIRVTPAMEAGISNHIWTYDEIIELLQ